MRVETNAPPPLILLIGIAFLAGACALAYFSSVATLTATRISPSSVDVVIEDRLFALWPVGTEPYRDVRGARSVIPQLEGSSRTSTARFFVFDTGKGPVYMGPSHGVFLRDVDTIREFVADPSRTRLVIHATDTASELFRFLFAQAGVLLLALLGGFLLWLGVRALFPDPNAGIGPV
jgi:hypothetical protein